MSYAALDALRVAKASKSALIALGQIKEQSETHARKIIMVERIEALSRAAAETTLPGGGLVTLTSEEFWLISKNW